MIKDRPKDDENVNKYIAEITSIPAAYDAKWRIEGKIKGKFYPVDTKAQAFEGTSNSLPCPVLIVQRNEIPSTQCFQIVVTNHVGSNSERILGNYDTRLYL